MTENVEIVIYEVTVGKTRLAFDTYNKAQRAFSLLEDSIGEAVGCRMSNLNQLEPFTLKLERRIYETEVEMPDCTFKGRLLDPVPAGDMSRRSDDA